MSASNEEFTEFANGLHGELIRPEDAKYEEARRVWNAMIDRRPAVIVRCKDADDVIQSITFAKEHGFVLAVRGGGHNVSGNAVCDEGLVIDLSLMKDIRVDEERRTAVVGAGVTWGEFDQAAQRAGLATTGGVVPATGVAGLALGGGSGFLARTHGLACASGPWSEGEKILRPVRELAPPILDDIKRMSYVDLQGILGPAYPPGARNYWKSGFLDDLGEEAVDTMVRHAESVPSKRTQIVLEYLGGAVSRVGERDTAFGHRDPRFALVITSICAHPAEA